VVLPRDAMLARYMLSSCVRLSVRPFKPILYRVVLYRGASFDLSYIFRVTAKIRVLPPAAFPQTVDLENFATVSRWRGQQNSSTVEPVDRVMAGGT